MSSAQNNLTVAKNEKNLSIVDIEENTFRVLQETLYPGSTDQEVAMILNYCKARKIDPILKPVHLVPMNVKTDKKDRDGKYIYERKNVIMPGIGLYRIDASRSGQYAGMSEPEFGDEITKDLGKKSVTFPKWAKITVKKLLSDGSIAEFTAKEFWLENYASKSKFDESPNDIWEKRAYGQLAKCAEAQALRKAFPDVVGNEYTKEEMEGKTYFHDDKSSEKKARTFEHNEKPEATSEPLPKWEDYAMQIMEAENVDALEKIYKESYKFWALRKDQFALQEIMKAKDKRKTELTVKEFNEEYDAATGEVHE
jgi:phage recombination protein Bet